ncbi:MAG: energy-coupling factor transporter ATPase, partial [Firmicutes bacterium]|nr:energy-coupling factor transporter ATPase [Bacillota bacterium]
MRQLKVFAIFKTKIEYMSGGVKMCFIDGKNLCYKYGAYGDEKSTNALNDINIKINKGEFVSVLGHNGSGKSTLAKTFNALIIPEGTLVINGLDVGKEENIWEIRKSVGMVFQNPDNQIIASVVEEDAAFGPENLGIESDEIVKRVDDALENVGMAEYRKSEPSHLSGGQKQRIAIAGILAMMPECIVLDEPTAMLDPIGRREVMQTIEKLKRENNITVVLITHFMDEAAKAERLIVMNEGQIVTQGKAKDVFADVKKMKKLRLDVPYMAEIAYRLRECGFNIRKDIYECDEMADELIKIGFREKFDFENEKREKISSEVILKIENLNYIYEENTVFEKRALNNINIEIRKGEFIGLIGHTGSGKSTLIQHLNGLLEPSRGKVFLNGEDIWEKKNRKKIRQVRFAVGLCFQYPEYQIVEETVFSEIAFGP